MNPLGLTLQDRWSRTFSDLHSDGIMESRRIEMAEPKMPHPAHEQHLCYLQNLGYVESNLEDYKKLVKNPRFVCKNCGRAAADEKNLCKPDKL